jgi:hypothetical protein
MQCGLKSTTKGCSSTSVMYAASERGSALSERPISIALQHGCRCSTTHAGRTHSIFRWEKKANSSDQTRWHTRLGGSSVGQLLSTHMLLLCCIMAAHKKREQSPCNCCARNSHARLLHVQCMSVLFTHPRVECAGCRRAANTQDPAMQLRCKSRARFRRSLQRRGTPMAAPTTMTRMRPRCQHHCTFHTC